MHFGECMDILYNIEMIMLIVEMMQVLLTHEDENTSGTIIYHNKKVASESSYIMITYGKYLLGEQSDRNVDG
jgi:hypothetical protein